MRGKGLNTTCGVFPNRPNAIKVCFSAPEDCRVKDSDPTDKHVGSRVRMRRLMLGLSQTKLADELGLTFQQVQKYEKGVNRISASKLQHISEFLQVPIPFFFEGLPGPSEQRTKKDGTLLPSDVFQFVATPDGLSLAKSFTQIRNPNFAAASLASSKLAPQSVSIAPCLSLETKEPRRGPVNFEQRRPAIAPVCC